MGTKKNKTVKPEVAEELVEEVLNEVVMDGKGENSEALEVEEEVAPEPEKDELTLALEKAIELSDKHLRLQAEFDNYRKRTLKEKMELTKTAGERILNEILPVMDDFDRAMETLDSAEDITAVKDGIHLIYSKLEKFLTQQGVQEIATENEELNTDRHEAITQIPAPSKDLKGKIVACVQKGYTLNDKVMRHSKVVVGA